MLAKSPKRARPRANKKVADVFAAADAANTRRANAEIKSARLLDTLSSAERKQYQRLTELQVHRPLVPPYLAPIAEKS